MQKPSLVKSIFLIFELLNFIKRGKDQYYLLYKKEDVKNLVVAEIINNPEAAFMNLITRVLLISLFFSVIKISANPKVIPINIIS